MRSLVVIVSTKRVHPTAEIGITLWTSSFQSSDKFTSLDPSLLTIHQLTLHTHLHSTTTFIFHPSTSIPSLSSSIAFTRSTLAVGCSSKSPLRICSYTIENPKRISPLPEPEPTEESESRPRRDREARRVASRMSLGQDDRVGVKIAMRAVRTSECLSSCRVSWNRLVQKK